jgi:hypothetical protein
MLSIVKRIRSIPSAKSGPTWGSSTCRSFHSLEGGPFRGNCTTFKLDFPVLLFAKRPMSTPSGKSGPTWESSTHRVLKLLGGSKVLGNHMFQRCWLNEIICKTDKVYSIRKVRTNIVVKYV